MTVVKTHFEKLRTFFQSALPQTVQDTNPTQYMFNIRHLYED